MKHATLLCSYLQKVESDIIVGLNLSLLFVDMDYTQ